MNTVIWDEVEDETHFILFCPLYDDLRAVLFQKVQTPNLDLVECESSAVVEFLFDHIFAFSEYLYRAWDRRRGITYN